VPTGPHAGGVAPVVVDAPPPSAKVEDVPDDPGGDCRWLDGRWEWEGAGWQWREGRWVVPPRECHFAPPIALWVPSASGGALFYRGGAWYRTESRTPCGATVRGCGSKATDADGY
jgi:hypothetical protein